jgi:amino acid adenylation domain-containing protein
MSWHKHSDIWNYIEMFAAEQGSRTAITDKHSTLSYEQLKAASEKLSAFITGSHTALLFFDQGCDMIIAMLAALKEKTAYVPVAKDTPAARLDYIISTTLPDIIITNQYNFLFDEYCSLLSEDIVDTGSATLRILKVKKTAYEPLPLNPAYILFTSGSTGKPKGVMQTEENIIRHIGNYSKMLDVRSSDRVSLVSYYTFDASVMDIFGALLNGAQLYIYEARSFDIVKLKEMVIRDEISIFHSVPTLYRYFAGSLQPQQAPSIRMVVLGGEEVKPSDVHLFNEKFCADAIFINNYGPTECTLAAGFKTKCGDPFPYEIVPLGTAYQGITIRFYSEVTGEVNEVEGEILLSSPQLTPGYFGLEELNRQSFVNLNGTVYYKTGDIGYRLENGLLAFSGRKGSKLKISGHTIELTEITACLNKAEGLVNHYITGIKNSAGDDRLVLFVEWEQGQKDKNIRRHLRTYLPAWMVPSQIYEVEKFPVTATGKTDRPALNAMAAAKPVEHETDTSPLLDKICALFSENLETEKITAHNNYFEAGGDSIRAILLLYAIEQKFDLSLSIDEFMDDPTPASVAIFIRDRAKIIRTTSQKQHEGGRISELSYAQQRYWNRIRSGYPNHAFNVAFLTSIQGELNTHALEIAFRHLINNNEILRTSIKNESGGDEQVIYPEIIFSLEILSLETCTEKDQESELQKIMQQVLLYNFDLAKAPLFQVKLIKLDHSNYRMFLLFHHLITDGWSRKLFNEQLSKYYKNACGIPAPVPERSPVQYADYVQARREQISFKLQEKITYWKNELRAFNMLELPQEINEGNLCSARKQFFIATQVFQQCSLLARKLRTTKFIVFLAIFKATLKSVFAGQEIFFTTDVSNRDELPWQNVLGLFSDVVVLNTRLELDDSFENNVSSEAFKFQSNMKKVLPLTLLLQKVMGTPDPEYDRLFPIAFIYQQKENKELDLWGTTTETIELANQSISRPLIFEMKVDDASAEINIEFHDHALLRTMVNDIHRSFLQLTNTLLGDPGITISKAIELFKSQDERKSFDPIH